MTTGEYLVCAAALACTVGFWVTATQLADHLVAVLDELRAIRKELQNPSSQGDGSDTIGGA